MIICKTNNAGIKTNFHSISKPPVFSETKAKLIDKKMQRIIVFIIILFLVVLIFAKKLMRYLGFIGQLIGLVHKFRSIKEHFITEIRKANVNFIPIRNL